MAWVQVKCRMAEDSRAAGLRLQGKATAAALTCPCACPAPHRCPRCPSSCRSQTRGPAASGPAGRWPAPGPGRPGPHMAAASKNKHGKQGRDGAHGCTLDDRCMRCGAGCTVAGLHIRGGRLAIWRTTPPHGCNRICQWHATLKPGMRQPQPQARTDPTHPQVKALAAVIVSHAKGRQRHDAAVVLRWQRNQWNGGCAGEQGSLQACADAVAFVAAAVQQWGDAMFPAASQHSSSGSHAKLGLRVVTCLQGRGARTAQQTDMSSRSTARVLQSFLYLRRGCCQHPSSSGSLARASLQQPTSMARCLLPCRAPAHLLLLAGLEPRPLLLVNLRQAKPGRLELRLCFVGSE